MPERIDKIYDLMLKQQKDFFDYAQKDNRDKEEIKKQIGAVADELKDVHAQTRATNGRVTKLEDIVVILQTDKDNRTRAYKLTKWGARFVWGLFILIISPILYDIGNFLEQHIKHVFR